MKCKNCQIELEISKTKPRVFCSDRCTKAYNRKLLEEKITDKKITDNIGQEKTDNEGFAKKYGLFCQKNGERITGKCRWCGTEIKQEIYGNWWNLVECCYDCTAKRNNIKRELYPIK